LRVPGASEPNFAILAAAFRIGAADAVHNA
jgi:hypothetical protein